MAIIAQKKLFEWKQIEATSDLQRLVMAQRVLPDEALMRVLEEGRKGRRDDYPVRPMWNATLAGELFGHQSVESLCRELRRNAELRQVCGFDLHRGMDAVPPQWVWTRFWKKLYKHQDLIDAMFDHLVSRLQKLLPGYGRHLAVDSKAIQSFSTGRNASKDDKPGNTSEAKTREKKKSVNKSSDPDADWGTKTYQGVGSDGTAWKKVQSWFGYKLHLIVDAVHELPVAWDLTKASVHDNPMLKPLVEQLSERHGELVQKAETMMGDRAYDAQETNKYLHDQKNILPIIDNRMLWKEDPHMPRPLDGERVDTIFHRETGEVVCRCQDGPVEADNYAAMAFCGFEKDRQCLKYRCPAAAYGLTCMQQDICNGGQQGAYGRIVRVPLETDRRIFIPTPRNSYKFKGLYKKRTSVERVNGRLDNSFGFEKHFIRGMKKMRLRMGLALVVMLAMAVAWIEDGQQENMRSLVRARAA